MEEVAMKKDIKEVKELVGSLMDMLEKGAKHFRDGKKIMDELKDLDMAECVELGMVVMLRLPKLVEAFKKEVE